MRIAVQVCRDDAVGIQGCGLAAELGYAADEADGARGEVFEVGTGEAGGGEGVCHFFFVAREESRGELDWRRKEQG